MSKYLQIKEEQQKKFDDFAKDNIIWIIAMTEKKLLDELNSRGLKPDDVVSIGHGAFVKKENYDNYIKLMLMLNKNDAFMQIIHDDEEVKKAILYELANHEYCITYDLDDTLEALGITRQFLQDNPEFTLKMNDIITKDYLSNLNSF